MVVGDALGVPVEFTSREERALDPVREMRGFGTHNQPPGTWSDDTSLALCTLQSLLFHGFDLHDQAKRFVRYFRQGYLTPHGKMFDIGRTTADAIKRIERGDELIEVGGADERDNGNGSLMRFLPMALYFYLEKPASHIEFVQLSSQLTHAHKRSQMACGYASLLAQRLLLGENLRAAYANVNEVFPSLYKSDPWNRELPHFARLLSGKLDQCHEASIHGSGYVIHTLEASVYWLLRGNTFSETTLGAVNLGDDTDTTGCVAGALAGLLWGQDAIPQRFLLPIARRAELGGWFGQFADKIIEHTMSRA